MSFRYDVQSGFLNEDECVTLIDYFTPMLKPSEVIGDSYRRNSEDVFVDHRSVADTKVRAILDDIRARFSELSGLPSENQELLTIMRYRPGQRFESHYDAFTDESDMRVEELLGGQRVCTFLVCLRRADEGGSTRFERIDSDVLLSTGDCLSWWNVDAHGSVYEDSLHAGLSPVSGEKWVLSCWVRAGRHVPVGHHFIESMLSRLTPDEVRRALATISLQ